MDAGALDDLDLDDMFAEDGDMLFEGLDIGLEDGMGDMIGGNTEAVAGGMGAAIEPIAAQGPKTKRPGGPRTKRTNPMLEKAEKEEEAAGGSKRRKTKRKSKNLLDELGIEDEPPKKRRKATMKKAEPVISTTKTKRRKKTDGTAASTLKSSTGVGVGATGIARALPTSSVAAAGQFGGRLKKPKVKRKLKKSDGSSESIAAAPIVLLKAPKPEPTFGGLKPSSTFFYPFLESVPIESTMQKRKTYPIMDRVSSTLTSQLLSYTPKVQDIPILGVTKDSAIFKLMLETYENSEKDKKNFTLDKRTALLKVISHLRKMVHKADKQNLVKDIFAMCGLLTREYNFLKQTLENMKSWCKTEFDDDKYKETYEPPIEQPKIKKWKSNTGVIRVKVVCTGFKEPKLSMPLLATLPAIVFDPSSRPLLSSSAATAKGIAANGLKKGGQIPGAALSGAKAALLTKTKKKGVLADKTKTKAGAASQAPSGPKSYADSTPLARRQQIVERVSQLALELESSLQKERVVGRLDPVPEEQPPLHTTRMWEWLQSAGFYNKGASSKILASIKSPKMHSRGPFQSTPRSILGREIAFEEDDNDKEETTQVSAASLFDRLQSLLVEVVSEDDMDDDNEEDSDEESLGFLDDDGDNVDEDYESKVKALEDGELTAKPKFDIADLSELSLEERTFLHLSKAGLIKKSLYPSVNLITSTGKDEEKKTEDLGDVIGAMSADLTKMTSMNNSRISYIERLTSDADVFYNKQVEEEQAVLIAKCQNLMKRTKEKAKKAKQKKDENLNLPW